MKAKELLKFIVDNQISTEDSQIIEIDDAKDFPNNGGIERMEFESQSDWLETFFGCKKVDKEIPAGDYIYFYSNNVDSSADWFKTFLSFAEIILDCDGDLAYLIRIED